MIKLIKTLKAWGTENFEAIAKMEIEQLSEKQLPLQQALSNSSYALDTNLKAIIINASEEENIIRVKSGIFYTGIIYGCNCADDPTPVDELPEQCEVQLEINKLTAETNITLLGE